MTSLRACALSSLALLVACSSPSQDPIAPSTDLAALAIDGHVLSPPFSPAVHDYTIRCVAGANPLTVRTTAASPVTVRREGSAQQSVAGSSQGAKLELLENDAAVVQVAGGKEPYWVRCLPHDFPTLTFTRTAHTAAGYYLLGNSALSDKGAKGYAMALDELGTPVWYRRTDVGACFVEASAKNTIAVAPILGFAFGTDPDGAFEILELETSTTKRLRTVDVPTDMHDYYVLPNGNALVFSYPLVPDYDLSARGETITDIVDCEIQELTPKGELAWRWIARDHFDAVKESVNLFKAKSGGKDVLDVFHCNSIDVAKNGDLLVSARHLDAIFLISRETGKVVWKLGGSTENKDGAQHIALPADATFHHQHDARFLPDGTISLFDNHAPQPGPARALEVALDLAASTARVTYEYKGPFTSLAMGSYRKHGDGSRLVAWGLHEDAPPPLAMTELDASGKEAARLWFASGDFAYRVVKVPRETLDIDVLRRAVTAK